MKSLRSYFYRTAGWLGMDLDWGLRHAAMQGQRETVKALLEAGMDAKHGEGLGRVAVKDYTEVAKILLETEVAKILLEADADVNEGLRLAAENGHEETVKLLKEWMARGQGSADHESDQGPGPSITPPGP